MAERINKSGLWEYFTPNKDGKSSTCHLCKSVVKRPNRNTSNMAQHLATHHRQEHHKLQEAEKQRKLEKAVEEQGQRRQQPTLLATVAKSTYYLETNPKKKKLDRLVTSLVCKEGLPFRLVGTPSFQKFVSELDPRYRLPTRQFLSGTLIPDMYTEVKKDTMIAIKSAAAWAFTTDMWTSSNNDSYMALTCHFINDGFELINKCVAVTHAPGSHSAEFIADKMTQVLNDWGFDTTSTTFRIRVVTDSASNNKRAMLHLLKYVIWHPCFAHTLQLVVNGGLNAKEFSDLNKLLVKARAIVGHFRRSPLATEALKNAQTQLGIQKHKLLQDVTTRWNSQVTMLVRMIEQRQAITLVLSSTDVVPNLTAAQWSTAKDLEDALQPFLEVTDIMSSASYPTLSMIIPVLDGLINLLRSTNGGLDLLRSAFIKLIEEKFGDVYNNDELCIATVLDPRFKLVAFTNIIHQVSARAFVLTAMERGATCRADAANNAGGPNADAQAPMVTTPAPSTVPLTIWSKFDQAVVVANADVPRADENLARVGLLAHNNELDLYLREPPIDRRTASPLAWWATNGNSFPLLSYLAKQYMCVPATSVPSERAFSKAGDVITKKRNLLKPEKAEQVLFLMENQ